MNLNIRTGTSGIWILLFFKFNLFPEMNCIILSFFNLNAEHMATHVFVLL